MNNKTIATLEKFKNKMRVRNYSNSTIETYSNCTYNLLSNYPVDAYHIPVKTVVEFLENKKYTSVSQQNQYINAVKLFYKEVIGLKMDKVKFIRPRKEYKLPKVISKDHLLTSIDKISNVKHKSIITLSYSVGLRVSEVINLKICDIDSKRMVINIKQSKGNKDRIVPLTENLLTLLRLYFIQFKPKEYLFNGQNKPQYSANSCNKIVKKYIGKEYHFHCLRHSCFTHLTDKGIDIRVIQKLAGHSSSKTTEIYTQVSTQLLSNLPLAV